MLSGLRIGRFELVRPLGRGAGGQVWEAREPSTQRRVALKLLSGSGPPLERELHRAATLDHQNIVGVLEHGVVQADEATEEVGSGSPWIAFELVEGPSLAQGEPDETPSCWEDVRDVLLAVLDALAHAHARGVVHLDIKPSNLLVGPLGFTDVRLTDFGVAIAWDRTERAAIYGTPPYMAPEQFSQSPAALGPWTDLYAIGCLTYALCTGRPPVATGPVQEQALAHRNRDYLAFETRFPVPPELTEWSAALLVASANRPRSAFRVAHALRRMGPATWVGEARAAPQSTAAATVTLSSLDTAIDLEPPPDPPARTGLQLARPPLPDRWPTSHRPAPRSIDVASAVSIARLRALPLLERASCQEPLWTALRQLASGTAQRIWLHGPQAVGRHSVMRWLEEASGQVDAGHTLHLDPGQPEALGAAVRSLLKVSELEELEERARAMGRNQIWVEATRRALARPDASLQSWLDLTLEHEPHLVFLPDHPDALALVRQDTPTLWLVRSTRPPPEPGWIDLPVPPLCPARLEVLLRHLLPLEPQTAHRFIQSSEGRPGLLVRQLLQALPSLDLAPEGYAGHPPPQAQAASAVPQALALAAFDTPVPTPIARDLLGRSLEELLADNTLWEAEGHVSFVTPGTARATRASADHDVHLRAAHAARAHCDAPVRSTGYDPLLLATEQLELAAEPDQAATLGLQGLFATCGSRSLREWTVLAWRTRNASSNPTTDAAWRIERAALDRLEGRLQRAIEELESLDPPPSLRLRWAVERGRVEAMRSDLDAALAWMSTDDQAPAAGTAAYRDQMRANALAWLGRRAEAIPAMDRAHAAHVEAHRYVSAGYSALRLGRWTSDLAWLERARSHFELADHALGLAETRGQLGHRARASGDLAAAARHYTFFLRVGRAHGRGDAVFGLLNLGLVRIQQEHDQAAEALFREARSEANVHGNVEATVAAQLGIAAAQVRTSTRERCEQAVADALGALASSPSREPDVHWLLAHLADSAGTRGWMRLQQQIHQSREAL